MKVINPFVYFFVLFLFIFFLLALFFFSSKPLCAPCVKWEMCLGKDGHKYSEYISRDSWEGLEKRNPSCGTAEYFCELLFTSCWTSFHLFTFYCASYIPDKSLFIHVQGRNNSFYSWAQSSSELSPVLLVLPGWYGCTRKKYNTVPLVHKHTVSSQLSHSLH